MAEDREDQNQDGDEEVSTNRPAPRNPFANGNERTNDYGDPPVLIDSRRSAAVAGVIVGLVALLFFVAICVLGSIAFG